VPRLGIDLNLRPVGDELHGPGRPDHGGNAELAGDDRRVAEGAALLHDQASHEGQHRVVGGSGEGSHEHVAGLEPSDRLIRTHGDARTTLHDVVADARTAELLRLGRRVHQLEGDDHRHCHAAERRRHLVERWQGFLGPEIEWCIGGRETRPLRRSRRHRLTGRLRRAEHEGAQLRRLQLEGVLGRVEAPRGDEAPSRLQRGATQQAGSPLQGHARVVVAHAVSGAGVAHQLVEPV
jgi:hypothetical protein